MLKQTINEDREIVKDANRRFVMRRSAVRSRSVAHQFVKPTYIYPPPLAILVWGQGIRLSIQDLKTVIK